ncbi:CBN-CYP-33D1 protein, partial [Aphelenchoides avenae]
DRQKEFFELKGMLSEFLGGVLHPLFAILRSDYGPLTRFCVKLPYIKQHADYVKSKLRGLMSFYERQIDEHLKHIDLNSESEAKDFAEAFLREQAKRDRAGEHHFYTRPQLISMCFDLFLAGQETTSTTLAWGFAYLLHNPDVQRKVHDELDSVIGSERLITVDDKHSLPYLNAVIAETHRICNLLPQNLLHRTTKDVLVDGYHLPKGACIIPQLSGVFYDDQ